MIIQCEQCSTKFRLDDAKIKDKGVKVRCAKCRHVFTVTKQQDMESASDAPTGVGQPFVPAPDDASTPAAVAQGAPSGPPSAAAGTEEFSFAPPAAEPPSAPASVGAVDFGFSFSDETADAGAGHDEAPAPANEADFSDFDFGDVPAAKEPVNTPPPLDFGGGGFHATPPAPAPDAASFDFGDDNLFGDAVAAPAPEEPAEPISFDFSVDAFADSLGAAEKTPGGKGAVSGIAAAKADEPFSLGEIDFGDELTSVAVQHVNPEELKPAQELLFAPLAEAQEKKISGAEEKPAASDFFTAQEEELPPLSISSRRKQSPVFMVVVVALVVAVAALLGYAGYSMLGGEKKVAKEGGVITVRGVNAAFVKNSAAGELVVISGEAVNGFAAPRAAIQVKGMIYGPNGQVLASKSAFCGNPLTREQLASMPLDKIEAAMANQFGDSLDNLEVPPGKAIPFVIVIAKPPADARDYGVQPAGSTVATEKQP